MQLASYDRESVNTVFQGSAADLIKLSMLKLEKTLLNEDARLLLQIHDELIFEVKEELSEEFAKKAKELMEGIYTLEIPLKTSVAIGKNWGELK
jgi:DNA polymerase-1